MKKQIIVSSIIAATILSGTGIAVLNENASAEPNTDGTPLLATTNSLSTPKLISTSKNETVYVITDDNGNPKSKFIGSTLYKGTEELPFNFKVTYYLDGQEISGKDLAGKSGHVKIVYNYDSTAKYQGKFVPFLAVTGVTLDSAKFNNVKVSNGKIISESSNNYIITGYGLAGINQDLGVDFLPDNFTIEADATDFKLENTYTVFLNDILADLDTSKLNTLDELTSSVYQLEDGINKLVNGATELSNGLGTALDGTKTLFEGSKTLAGGISELSTGATAISSGLNTLTEHNNDLRSGIATIIEGIINNLNNSLAEQGITITTANYSVVLPQVISNFENSLTQINAAISAYCGGENVPAICLEHQATATTLEQSIASLTQSTELLAGFIKLKDGIIDYTDNVERAANGSKVLVAGAAKLAAGATEISKGLGNLVEGETKLYEGSVTLKDGLSTFKTVGIDRLVNFANKDLSNFTRNARSTINAAASYKNFGNTDAKSVKFIVKTPSI
ncbi:MAG: hypothetical protein Q4A36_01775 [Candidatus Saccharibacteria bacterium]|nr:hypothetical protein [Candidatus Saccharibacteria bacterium]